MRPPIQLPDLQDIVDSDFITLAGDIAGMRPWWLIILAMAVKDEANALRWQPWESGHILTYTVGLNMYQLLEPGESLGAVAFEAAKRLISPGVGGWMTQKLRHAGAGVLRFESAWGPSEWHGTWWSAGTATGVDFTRLDRFPIPSDTSAGIASALDQANG